MTEQLFLPRSAAGGPISPSFSSGRARFSLVQQQEGCSGRPVTLIFAVHCRWCSVAAERLQHDRQAAAPGIWGTVHRRMHCGPASRSGNTWTCTRP